MKKIFKQLHRKLCRRCTMRRNRRIQMIPYLSRNILPSLKCLAIVDAGLHRLDSLSQRRSQHSPSWQAPLQELPSVRGVTPPNILPHWWLLGVKAQPSCLRKWQLQSWSSQLQSSGGICWLGPLLQFNFPICHSCFLPSLKSVAPQEIAYTQVHLHFRKPHLND